MDKTINKMRNNPRDWRIEDLTAIADRLGIDYRQPGGSHMTFRTKTADKVTVPIHKPIKAIYIQKFLALIDSVGGNDE